MSGPHDEVPGDYPTQKQLEQDAECDEFEVCFDCGADLERYEDQVCDGCLGDALDEDDAVILADMS